jgi:hypothetical protein
VEVLAGLSQPVLVEGVTEAPVEVHRRLTAHVGPGSGQFPTVCTTTSGSSSSANASISPAFQALLLARVMSTFSCDIAYSDSRLERLGLRRPTQSLSAFR